MRAWPRFSSLLLVVLCGTGATAMVNACSVGEIDIANRECPCSAPGWACDQARNVCVPIEQLNATVDGGINGGDGSTTPVADAAPECSVSPSDTCPVGSYCLATSLSCAPGCKADVDCAQLSPSSPFCNVERHQCVACRSQADCPQVNQDCTPAGSCADKCTGDAASCPAGQKCCSGLCVDTTNDIFNCNGCGMACAAGSTLCCASVCTNPLTSANNCGGCGTKCSTLNGSPSCTAGACKWACATGFSHCQAGNTGCETNTSSNPTQCGSCTTNCNTNVKNASGIFCIASACTYQTCNQGFGDCDSNKANGCECVSTCGALGQPCCTVGGGGGLGSCNQPLFCKKVGGNGTYVCQ